MEGLQRVPRAVRSRRKAGRNIMATLPLVGEEAIKASGLALLNPVSGLEQWALRLERPLTSTDCFAFPVH